MAGDYLDETLVLTAALLRDEDVLGEERARCLHVLQLTDPRVQLNIEIQAALKVKGDPGPRG